MDAKCEVCDKDFDDSQSGYTVMVDRRSKNGVNVQHSYDTKDCLVTALPKLP